LKLQGVGEDLEHVTKARAKPPAARRRPPTRQHIRNRVGKLCIVLKEIRIWRVYLNTNTSHSKKTFLSAVFAHHS